MYEDKTYKINWLGIIVKLLLVALIIGILFWIIPKTNNNAYKNEVFTNNLNNMKSAAKDYFKGNKLPSKIGDSKVITLDKMEESKLLVPFTDYDDKACDATNSYAQVTKNSDTEYSLKVNLSCNSKEEYVLDSIETTTVSTPTEPEENTESDNTIIDNESENNSNIDNTTTDNNTEDNSDNIIDANEIEGDKDGNIYEFEYRRLISAGKTEYTCPVGYERKGNKCYKITFGSQIDATVLYFPDSETIEDAKVNTTGSVEVTADAIKEFVSTKESCSEGYTLNNNTCIKYVDATVVPGSTAYTCENGGTLSGTKCIITIDVGKLPSETTRSCPNGGTLRGNTCEKTTTYGATQHKGSTSCSCPRGGSLNGTQCVSTTSTPAITDTTPGTCSCPSGSSNVGGRCAYVSNATLRYGAWSNPQSIVSYTPLSQYENATSKQVLVKGPDCSLGRCTYLYYRYTRSTYYSCSSGTQSGSKCYTYVNQSCTSGRTTQRCANGTTPVNGVCYSTSSYSASCTTTNSTYTCPNGGTLQSNRTCVKDESYPAVVKETPERYDDCPAGYTKTSDGAHCTKTYDAKKTEGTTTYTCPEGYTLDGTTCYKTTEIEKEDIYKYTCPEGYIATGENENTKCTKTVQVDGNYYCEDSTATLVDDKCIKRKQGAIRGYECPSGYVKEGTVCIKKDVHCVYPSPHVIEEAKYEYTWSIKTELEGWERTGNQRIASSETLDNLTIK